MTECSSHNSGEDLPLGIVVAMENSPPKAAKQFVVACIPAYNEEGTIAKIILQTKPYVDKVIVCDDGSSDMTAAIASSLGVLLVSHPKRKGYGGALATLFQAAREINTDIMVTLDADGQHDPKFIPDLVAPITSNTADLVVGSRFLGSSSVPKARKMGIRIINNATNMAGYKDMTDTQSGYRAYGRAAINTLMPVENGMGASTEILLKAKSQSLRMVEVPVVITYGGSSPTQNPVVHGFSVFVNTIKYSSIEHPLMLFGIPGIILLIVGFYFGAFGMDIYFNQHHLPINIALAAVGSVIFGFMLITTMLILWVLSSIVKELRPGYPSSNARPEPWASGAQS
jgi:glycosyltransferase involved in cell wall biosynthesis